MSAFDQMNPQNYGYGYSPTNSWTSPRGYQGYPAQTQPQYRLNTNAAFVTSLDEALIKTNDRNSDMIYFHQDKNEFYRVKVDAEGRKSWAIFAYTLPDQENTSPATKADILALVARIEALEAAKEAKPPQKAKKKEVVENGESDG